MQAARGTHLPPTLSRRHFPKGSLSRPTYPLVSTEGGRGGLAQICRKPLSQKVRLSQLYIIDTKNRFAGKKFNGPDTFRGRGEDVSHAHGAQGDVGTSKRVNIKHKTKKNRTCC